MGRKKLYDVDDKTLVREYITQLRAGKRIADVAASLNIPTYIAAGKISKLRTEMLELHDVVLPCSSELRADAVKNQRKQALADTASEVSNLLV